MKLSKFLNIETPFRLYDKQGNEVYYENSYGSFVKSEYDERGNKVYWENSDGDWVKRKFDEQGNEVYYEDNYGDIIDNRPKHTIVLDGKEIKISEESYQEFIKQFKGEK